GVAASESGGQGQDGGDLCDVHFSDPELEASDSEGGGGHFNSARGDGGGADDAPGNKIEDLQRCAFGGAGHSLPTDGQGHWPLAVVNSDDVVLGDGQRRADIAGPDHHALAALAVKRHANQLGQGCDALSIG